MSSHTGEKLFHYHVSAPVRRIDVTGSEGLYVDVVEIRLERTDTGITVGPVQIRPNSHMMGIDTDSVRRLAAALLEMADFVDGHQ